MSEIICGSLQIRMFFRFQYLVVINSKVDSVLANSVVDRLDFPKPEM